MYILKVHCPIFEKNSFLFYLNNHHPKDVDLKFCLKQSYVHVHNLYEAILYCSYQNLTVYALILWLP